MFRRILVALDGSTFAERALEPAIHLAQAFGSEVILLRVAAPEELLVEQPPLAIAFKGQPTSYPDLEGRPEQATAYLDGTKRHWCGCGVRIQTAVISGVPAETIVSTAHVMAADLIVMSTHGRSAVGRLIYGSVAEAVLRGAQLPVLLIPAILQT